MQTLLTLCEETNKILKKTPPEEPIAKLLKRHLTLKKYTNWIEEYLNDSWEVYKPQVIPSTANRGPEEKGSFHLQAPSSPNFKAISWNIERGKNFDSVLKTLKTHPELKEADFYFLTEVDWGMARSKNINIPTELGKELNLYSYFTPSYFNFTKGHGAERDLPGENQYGLHGKAILSRYPLKNIRAIKMSNTIDKIACKEARLGEKRALLASLELNGQKLALSCTHLDVFSSPDLRSNQLKKAVEACYKADHVLISGDWNTNTLNLLSHKQMVSSLLKQFFFTRPKRLIQKHYPYPERKFDKPIFEMLKNFGFDFENCNQLGVGTFDLFSNDEEAGKMGRDQFPGWILRWINRQIEKSGGVLSFKLDWFAAKNLNCLEKKVIRLSKGVHYQDERPSDHHPILLKFNIPTPANDDPSNQNNDQSHVKSSSESAL